MWPQFICPNCRAVADLEADVDNPFPDAEWEEVDADDAAEEQATSTQATNIASKLQVPSIERPKSTSRTGSVHGHGDSQENTGEDTTGSESELQHAMDHLNIAPPDTPAAGPQESHSLIGPVNIRSGRPTTREPNSSNGRTTAFDVESFMRNDRTPSPSSRLPVGIGDMLLGPDGPITPRNDAGPFVFDGSAGRAAAAQMSALNLTRPMETPPAES